MPNDFLIWIKRIFIILLANHSGSKLVNINTSWAPRRNSDSGQVVCTPDWRSGDAGSIPVRAFWIFTNYFFQFFLSNFFSFFFWRKMIAKVWFEIEFDLKLFIFWNKIGLQVSIIKYLGKIAWKIVSFHFLFSEKIVKSY